MNKDELYTPEQYIETPRGISSPVKISSILEQRIQVFMKSRERTRNWRFYGPYNSHK